MTIRTLAVSGVVSVVVAAGSAGPVFGPGDRPSGWPAETPNVLQSTFDPVDIDVINPLDGPPLGQHAVPRLAEMTWDDRTDGVLDEDAKVATVELESRGGRWQGQFFGPVLGEERDASFTGTTIQFADGQPRLLQLRQDDATFTCIYQGMIHNDGTVTGTWVSTHFGNGDFRINQWRPSSPRP